MDLCRYNLYNLIIIFRRAVEAHDCETIRISNLIQLIFKIKYFDFKNSTSKVREWPGTLTDLLVWVWLTDSGKWIVIVSVFTYKQIQAH